MLFADALSSHHQKGSVEYGVFNMDMQMMTSDRVLPIAGFPVREATPRELAEHLLSALRHRQQITLLFANSNFIVKCKKLLGLMRNDSVIIANDGIGMDIAARILHGHKFKANLNGTDFTPYFFHESARPLRVFLLGGRMDIVQKAATYVARHLKQIVVGYKDGYGNLENRELIEAINSSGAEVLLVALGNPLQEEWILANRDALNVPVVCGVGALFDFWAGEKPRAPKFIQKLRMEWLYRLHLEPRRLMRRYTVDALIFFADCLRNRKPNVNKQLKKVRA